MPDNGGREHSHDQRAREDVFGVRKTFKQIRSTLFQAAHADTQQNTLSNAPSDRREKTRDAQSTHRSLAHCIADHMLPDVANHYSNYSNKRVHDLCIDRGIPVPHDSNRWGYATRKDAVTALIRVDAIQSRADPSFCFENLPPNIRKLVYEQLLTFTADSGCHPNILATAPQIWEEASHILFDHNVLDIIIDKQTGNVHLSAWKYPDPSTSYDLLPCDRIGRLPFLHNEYEDGSLSDFVFYFKRIRLILDVAEFARELATSLDCYVVGSVDSEIQTFDRMSARIFAVSALLQDCLELQELVVDVRGCFTEKYRLKVMDAMLPLARLWGKVELKFHGFYPSDFIDEFIAGDAAKNASLYAIPLFRKACLLHKETVCFEALNKRLMSSHNLSKYHSARSELKAAAKSSFRDVTDEWLFNSSLEFLGRVFQNVYEEEDLFPPYSRNAETWRELAEDFEDAHEARVKELKGQEGTTIWN